ncbi:MAG: hypothetical protein P2A85_26810 [Microcoleus anatoxicus]|uniref:hypothetical protein n=1 Tax=Microcoleus anatoxicus TaxID=2705319 RepID=UPI00366FB0AA
MVKKERSLYININVGAIVLVTKILRSLFWGGRSLRSLSGLTDNCQASLHHLLVGLGRVFIIC